MTNEEIEEIISKVKVGQFWKDTRPPKFVSPNASGLMEVVHIRQVQNYDGRMLTNSITVSYSRNPLRSYPTPPKQYNYNPTNFAKNFVFMFDNKKEPKELPLDSKVQTNRFDNIID